MAREKKNGRYINYYIEKELVDKLDKYCKETGLSKTVAIERILGKYLDTYFAHPEAIRNFNDFILSVNIGTL